jgi:hypothetical protein
MKKGKDFRSQLECENDNNDDDMILVDGLDDAIIGYTDSWNGASWGRSKFIAGRPHRAVYDRDRCISILKEKGKISPEEVEQPFDIDEDSDYMAENGPIFVRVLKRRNRNPDGRKNLRSQFGEDITNLYQVSIIYSFDDAIIGYTDSVMGMDPDEYSFVDDENIIGRPVRLVYDRARCIEILKRKHAASRNKAQEDLESEESEYYGASTPVFVRVLKRKNA